MVKLLFDFGLVILIWMTQLVVYPSFTYFQASDLLRWHEKYTAAVSVIVMPLMLGQLVFHGYELSQTFSWVRLLALVLILLAWINTFFFAVPLHNKIAADQEVITTAAKLVSINWYRTLLWSVVFALTLYEHLKTQ